MNLLVALMVVVAVVLSSTFEYSEAFTSKDLCKQVKSGNRRILTMGARGRSIDDAHFYILAQGGYMFKVPLSKLHLDAAKRTTSISIDRHFIQADTWFDVSTSLFVPENRFCLVSDKVQNPFLGVMLFKQEYNRGAFQMLDLEGILPVPKNLKNDLIPLNVYKRIRVLASLGVHSDTVYAFGMDHSTLERVATIQMTHIEQFWLTEIPPEEHRFIMDFTSNTEIVTAFYHKENSSNSEIGYYYFLDSAGLVTVTPRQNAMGYTKSVKDIKDLYSDRFEVKLDSFIECLPTVDEPPKVPKRSTGQTTNETSDDDEPENGHDNWSNWTIALVVGICVIVLLLIALYCTHLTIERAKVKRRGRKARTLMSFVDSDSDSVRQSLASKASGVFQSVQNKITSLLGGHKSKQAKVVAKGKKGKKGKSKNKVTPKTPKTPKSKSPKSEAS